MCLDGFLSVFDPVGIDIADGNDLCLFMTQKLAQIAHSHPPDADEADRDAITRRIGSEDRSRHDCRDQKTSYGHSRAFKKLPASYGICLVHSISFHIYTLSHVFQ